MLEFEVQCRARHYLKALRLNHIRLVLDFLAVHPENQGKGIATALVQAGIKKAEELGVDILVLAFVGGFKVYNNTGFKSLWTYVQDATRFGGTKDYTVQLMEYEVEKK